MLKKMTLTNFLSFKEETVFDFTTSKYGILNTTNVSSSHVLKGGLFIGPNASGKSNALRGIEFLLKMMKGEREDPIVYWCIFGNIGTFYAKYEFEIKGATVCYQISYFSGRKNRMEELLTVDGKNVLTRDGTKGALTLGETTIESDQLDLWTPYLRTASFNTGKFPQEPVLHELMEFIMNSHYIGLDRFDDRQKLSINQYAEEHGVEALNRYLQDFHYDFAVEYGSKSEGCGGKMDFGDKKSLFYKRKSFPIPVPELLESQGNRVFISLLPHLIDVIEKPGMLVIDEFGNSMHNALAEKIVRFFMERADNSQLFVTSHCTNLISNSVFRPDQINLVTFHGGDGSRVKRLSAFKPREAQNLEKMYLSGMFEGLPDYGKDV